MRIVSKKLQSLLLKLFFPIYFFENNENFTIQIIDIATMNKDMKIIVKCQ